MNPTNSFFKFASGESNRPELRVSGVDPAKAPEVAPRLLMILDTAMNVLALSEQPDHNAQTEEDYYGQQAA